MDCPKCNTFNSQLDTVCSKCGHNLSKKRASNGSGASGQKSAKKNRSKRTEPSAETHQTPGSDAAKQELASLKTPLLTKSMVISLGVFVGLDLAQRVSVLFVWDKSEVPGAQLVGMSLSNSMFYRLAVLLIWIVCGIVSLIWFSGVARDLRKLLPNRRSLLSPGSAVGQFFIPIWGFFHYYRLVANFYKASDPDVLQPLEAQTINPDAGYRDAAVEQTVEHYKTYPRLVSMWIASSILGVIGMMAVMIATTDFSQPNPTSLALNVYVVFFQLVVAVQYFAIVAQIAMRTEELGRRKYLEYSDATSAPVLVLPKLVSHWAVGFNMGAWLSSLLILFSVRDELVWWWQMLIGVGLLMIVLWGVARYLQTKIAANYHYALGLCLVVPFLFSFGLGLRGVVYLVGENSIRAQKLQAELVAIEKSIESSEDEPSIRPGVDITQEFAKKSSHGNDLLAEITLLSQQWPNSYTRGIYCLAQYNQASLESKIQRQLATEQLQMIDGVVPFEKEKAAFAKDILVNYAQSLERYVATYTLGQSNIGLCLTAQRVQAIQRTAIEKSIGPTITPQLKAELESAIDVVDVRIKLIDLWVEHGTPTDKNRGHISFRDKAITQKWIQLWRKLRSAVTAAVFSEIANNQKSNSANHPMVFESQRPLQARIGGNESKNKPKETKVALARRQVAFDKLPAGVKKVAYQTALGPMDMYVASAVPQANRGPAVFWISSVMTAQVFEQAVSLSKQGVSVYLPTTRGVGANPGNVELFYGELDDLVAAYSMVTKNEPIDSGRILILGTDTSGTLALLLAEQQTTTGGVVAVNPALDLTALQSTFAQTDAREWQLRSPLRFLPFLSSPTIIVTNEIANVEVFQFLQQTEKHKVFAQAFECIKQTADSDSGDSDNDPENDACDGQPVVEAIIQNAKARRALIPTQADIDSATADMGMLVIEYVYCWGVLLGRIVVWPYAPTMPQRVFLLCSF